MSRLSWNRGRRGTGKKPRRTGARGRPPFWTQENIVQALRCLARELGRTPSARDCIASDDTPSDAHIRNRFGTFNAAIVAAGLTPRRAGGRWKDRHTEVQYSNHRWVLPTPDPEKARALTEAKMAHWGFRGPARSEATCPPKHFQRSA